MVDNEVKIRILTQEDLIAAGCFNVESSINICEQAFCDYADGNVILPDKISVIFNQESQDRINCLPAAIKTEKIYGMKWVSVFPENPRLKNLSNLTAVILLSELESGFPIAFMEGSLCSNLRTASAGAIAAKYCAKKECRTMGFIGAGEQAKSQFLAMKAVRPEISVCYISSRTSESENRFVQQMKKFHPEVEFIKCSGNHKKAVEDADIIVTAISSQEKILKAEWIKPGAFYSHVAGLEDEFDVARKASKIICDNWETVKHRTQTISQMYKQGLLSDDDIYADLHQIIKGEKNGRENDDEFIYFNSVGMSFTDVALANWMYKLAVSKNVGRIISMKNKSMFDVD